MRVFNLLLVLWASNKYLAGPPGPAKDLLQPEAAHDSLWPTATTKQNILKFET